jgi:endonuclease/exonuclease/phosphatase family metal-dependent hydrolase
MSKKDWTYHTQFGSAEATKPRRNLLVVLLDGVMGLLTYVVGGLLLLAYISPYVSPEYAWFFALLGLVVPAVYLAGIILFLFWVIRWRWGYVVATLLLLMVGLPRVSLYYKIEILRNKADVVRNMPELQELAVQSYDRNSLKVMTYNIRLFYGDDGQSTIDSLAAFVNTYDPDILCLQEYREHAHDTLSVQFDSLISGDYRSVRYMRSYEGQTLAIYAKSKYRIVNQEKVDCADPVDTNRVSSVWADVCIDQDTVRIFNNHLRSTHIKSADGDYFMTGDFLVDTARNTKFRDMVKRFRENSISRSYQVDTLSKLFKASPYPVLVCGDFNDTPLSYAYERMSRGLNDAFRVCGRGFSYTYRGFYNTFRIDYVLASDEFELQTYEVPHVPYSDHYPVFVRMKLKNSK